MLTVSPQMERQSGWKKKTKEDIERIFAFCDGYKDFLDRAKTEREAARCIESALRQAGFGDGGASGKTFRINKGKEVVATPQE